MKTFGKIILFLVRFVIATAPFIAARLETVTDGIFRNEIARFFLCCISLSMAIYFFK